MSYKLREFSIRRLFIWDEEIHAEILQGMKMSEPQLSQIRF